MPTPDAFAAAVGANLDAKPSPQELDFLDGLRFRDEYLNSTSEQEAAETAEYAASVLQQHRRAFGGSGVQVLDEDSSAALSDGRWALLAELRRHYRQVKGFGGQPPAPMLLESQTIGDMFCYPPAHQLVITVDSGIPLRDLLGELRRRWPRMRAEGHVRRTRALEPKALALVRFNCLECAPDTPWRERLRIWNAASANPADWTYADVRAFQSDFRRAEASIAGARGGLAWFYDSDARTTKFDVSKLTDAQRFGLEYAAKYTMKNFMGASVKPLERVEGGEE